jgi:hypothetical protein
MRKIATAICGLSLLAGTAMAQPKPAAKPAKPAATAGGAPTGNAPPRVRNYDFDADVIDGELVRPEGEFLAARRGAEHGSLIRVRTDFIREIVKSAEDL